MGPAVPGVPVHPMLAKPAKGGQSWQVAYVDTAGGSKGSLSGLHLRRLDLWRRVEHAARPSHPGCRRWLLASARNEGPSRQ